MTSQATDPGYLAQPVGDFLAALAARAPAPAGGSAAALAVALAAGLCAKTARLSARQLTAERAEHLMTSAEQILAAAASLIDADALAYREVIAQTRHAASRAPVSSAPADPEPGAGQAGLAAALSAAADVPLRVVELAADVTELAARLAIEGNPALRGDAITGALLAQAGARAAATLVAVDLATAPGDPRHSRAGELLTRISRLTDRIATPPGQPV